MTASAPALLLCADSGPGVGLGHVSRCLALAEEAVARGWSAVLAADPGPFAPRLAELGIDEVPPARDAEAVRARAVGVGAGVVVLDDYRLPGDVAVHGALVIGLCDGGFGRRPADVLVDANLSTDPASDYPARVVLRGPTFAPVRAPVRSARARPPDSAGSGRVVVVMGGGSWPAVTEAALCALRDTGLPLRVTAVSPSAIAFPGGRPEQEFLTSGPPADLPGLFAAADLVVAAAGVTLLELCCIGVPTALVRLADNQARGYRSAVDRGVAVGLGSADELVADPFAAAGTLREVLLDHVRRAALAASAAATVDGSGAARVLAVAGAMATVHAREATSMDGDLLLAWRNDPDTRRYSRDTAVVGPSAHRRWLAAALAADDRLLLVVDSAEGPLGTVRFDRADGGWTVSVTVAPEWRGRGLAAVVLAEGEAALARRVGAVHVTASVHRDNRRSLAVFERAGYRAEPDGSAGSFGRWVRELRARPARGDFGRRSYFGDHE